MFTQDIQNVKSVSKLAKWNDYRVYFLSLLILLKVNLATAFLPSYSSISAFKKNELIAGKTRNIYYKILVILQ